VLYEAQASRPGSGRLVFRGARGQTRATVVRAESPLKLLLPKNHGDGAWAFVASFGGGLVSGDAIRLDIDVGERATAMLGTQSSTKVYRGSSEQRLGARVGRGALFVAIPDPVSCFRGASYEQHARIELAPDASLVFLDAFTCGRSAHGERWLFARYASRTQIHVAGRNILTDAILLDPAHGPLPTRMGRFDAFATLVALGPRAGPVAESFLSLPSSSDRTSVSAASIVDDGAILRVAATSAERCARAVREALAPLSSILGDDPFARKW
jgi:urease accessory protein